MNYALILLLVPALVALFGLVACQDPVAMAKSIDPEAISKLVNVQSIIRHDIWRWFGMFEDLLADYVQQNVMEGVVDKKTLKIGFRFLVNKAVLIIRNSPIYKANIGYLESAFLYR